jgi:hypothetical protein
LSPVRLICGKDNSDVSPGATPPPAFAKYLQPISRSAPGLQLRAVRLKQVAANMAK